MPVGCVQKLGILAMKNCDILYSFSLSNRRLFLKLCTIFKVLHGMCYFPPHVIFTMSTRTNFSRSFMLTQPFARTNSYFHSFVPDSVRQWNSSPEHVVNNSSFHLFKAGQTYLPSGHGGMRVQPAGVYIERIPQSHK